MIERFETGSPMSRIVIHAGVVYLFGLTARRGKSWRKRNRRSVRPEPTRRVC